MVYKENCLNYDVYQELRESVGWKKFIKGQAMMALNKSVYDVVAYDDNKAVAMGRVIGDGIYYTIVDIVVKPNYQGKQIGAQIIKRILNSIEENIPEGGKVSVQLIAAEGKEVFYEKQGFEKIPSEKYGHGMIKIIYK